VKFDRHADGPCMGVRRTTATLLCTCSIGRILPPTSHWARQGKKANLSQSKREGGSRGTLSWDRGSVIVGRGGTPCISTLGDNSRQPFAMVPPSPLRTHALTLEPDTPPHSTLSAG
jgi:hypothetical protein